MNKKDTEITEKQIMDYVDEKSLAPPPWIRGGTETTLRQIEILTKAWDTITNMSGHDRELNIKKSVIVDELTKQILEKMDLYLKSGQISEHP